MLFAGDLCFDTVTGQTILLSVDLNATVNFESCICAFTGLESGSLSAVVTVSNQDLDCSEIVELNSASDFYSVNCTTSEAIFQFVLPTDALDTIQLITRKENFQSAAGIISIELTITGMSSSLRNVFFIY